MINNEIKITAQTLVKLANTSLVDGTTHVEGWVPTPNMFNFPPMDAQEAEKANAEAIQRAVKYLNIAQRLLSGETVKGWMPGDEYNE